MDGIVVYEQNDKGHRGTYVAIAQRLLGATPLIGPLRVHLPALLQARRLICSSCDDHLVHFVLLSVFRSLLGRRTVGIAIRAERCINVKDWRNQTKRRLFQLVRKLPMANVVSILPFYAEPRLETLVADWILDPQFWDMEYLQLAASPEPPPELQDLRVQASGRLIVGSLGKQDMLKGADYFCRLYIEYPELRQHFLFVMIGDCSTLSLPLVDAFRSAGGMVVSRFVSDEELVASYYLLDCVWTCYSLGYNQSSGIFGRSIQIGKPAIVRSGSYLETLQGRINQNLRLALSISDSRADALMLCNIAKSKTIADIRIALFHEIEAKRFHEVIHRYLRITS